jgi:signal transduction histidine kinase
MAMIGFALVIVLLAVGVGLSVRHLETASSEQLATIRVEEREITLAERLRWSGANIAAAAQGYILTGDPELLARHRDAEAGFEEAIRGLRELSLSPAEHALVKEIANVSEAYKRTAHELLQRPRTEALVRSVQPELLPHQHALADALDRFSAHEEQEIQVAYDDAAAAEHELSVRTYGLLGLLFIAGLGLSWYFATALARSVSKTKQALELARGALSARDEVSEIVAHDLRNPLAVIVLRCSMLQAENDVAAMRRQARVIENLALRMEYLIKTMLDVAALEEGRLSLAPSRCEVGELLHQTADMFDNLLESKRLRLDRRIQPPELAIRADRERVLQVLSSLIANAITVSPPGGVIDVAAQLHDGEVRFAVSDAGPGIAAAHIAQIFDRFFKHEVREQSGTSLALFVAKGVTAAHGGRIWVESEAGRGSTFYFTVPAVEASATS